MSQKRSVRVALQVGDIVQAEKLHRREAGEKAKLGKAAKQRRVAIGLKDKLFVLGQAAILQILL